MRKKDLNIGDQVIIKRSPTSSYTTTAVVVSLNAADLETARRQYWLSELSKTDPNRRHSRRYIDNPTGKILLSKPAWKDAEETDGWNPPRMVALNQIIALDTQEYHDEIRARDEAAAARSRRQAADRHRRVAENTRKVGLVNEVLGFSGDSWSSFTVDSSGYIRGPQAGLVVDAILDLCNDEPEQEA
jgi:hypothetical protein